MLWCQPAPFIPVSECNVITHVAFYVMQKEEPKDQNAKMIKILSGEMAIELHLQFLIRNNNTDLMILKNTKVMEGSKRQVVRRAVVSTVC